MNFLVMFAFSFLTLFARAEVVSNLTKDGVVLKGYDAVSYFNSGKPLKGLPNISTQFNEGIYWFANEANKTEFLKDPKKYEPQFGGWCAFAVADSKSKVEVDPESFLIQDGRLLLFYNGFWGDTRNKWEHTKNKDPKTFLKDADANWPEVKNKKP
jgi:hypothetical protein